MNKYDAMLNFIKQYPLAGDNAYFNFIDQTNIDGNVSLGTVPYGQVVRRYVDGPMVMKMQFEIKQVKPLSQESNTSANAEEMQKVREFLEWINLQGALKNFPDFGEEIEILSLGTPEGVKDPRVAGYDDTSVLYSFPFEIIYIERN